MDAHKRKIFRTLFLFMLLCLPQSIFAGVQIAVRLLNDSPYSLIAVVQAADGTFLGQEVFYPGQQRQFVYNFNPSNVTAPSAPPVSMTPLVVVWKCLNESFYSSCQEVSPGALVRANGCPGGNYYCPLPKEQQGQQQTQGKPQPKGKGTFSAPTNTR